MKQAFITKAFRSESFERIQLCNEVIERYQGMGLRLTLRQLYYQLVSANVIRNTEREYKGLGSLLSDARLAGYVDWNAIEDRVRVPNIPQDFEDLGELVNAALHSYRLPRWRGQENYAELWVEKDALSGVLAPLGREYHVPIMVNRGYSSQSAMYEAAQRFLRAGEHHDHAFLFYLGDHDPSGEDMVRDVQDRLDRFEASVSVQKIALTMAQVRQYNPPPNPAKMSDSRAAAYVAEHGDESWEVDALPPDVLQQLIRDAILGVVDLERMEEVREQEVRDKTRLRAALDSLEDEEVDE